MANLAPRSRLVRRTWLPLLLSVTSLVSYACDGGGDDADDTDGIGGLGGGGIVVKPPTGGTSSDGSGGTATDNKPPFVSCTLPGQGTVPEGSMVLDDFDDGDAAVVGNGLRGTWYDYDDSTDGTHAPSWNDEPDGWVPEPGGLEEGGSALHVVGGGFTLWGSAQGLAPIWDDGKMQECLFDASGFDGITFWIRGEIDGSESAAVEEDRGVLKVGFNEPDTLPLSDGGRCNPDDGQCYDWHKTRITLSECWQKVSIPFNQFEQDGWGLDGGVLDTGEIVNLNLEIAQGNTYDYWIDQIEFFSGDPPEADEICDEGLGGAGGMGGGGP